MNERLYRSRDDRVISGVAGGLAERLDLDPAIVRVAWVVLTILSGGVLLLVYIVMALVVPEEPEGYVPPNHPPWQPEGAWQQGGPAGSGQGYGPSVAAAGGMGPSAGDQGPAPGPSGTPPGGASFGPAAPMGPGSPSPTSGQPMSRSDWRAARRAARRERGGGGAIVLGLLLVLVGGWFLVRRYVPEIDAGLIWPIIIVGLGVVLIAGSFRPRPDR
jgi:phage shock protein C